MSNPLSVRRVIIQTIDEAGKPIGKPSYGVMAADNECCTYNDEFESLEALNKAIEASESILEVADPFGDNFDTANHAKIGKDNFYGKDWQIGLYFESMEEMQKYFESKNPPP